MLLGSQSYSKANNVPKQATSQSAVQQANQRSLSTAMMLARKIYQEFRRVTDDEISSEGRQLRCRV